MRATRVLWLVVVVGARTIDPTGLETLAFGACTPPPAVGSARDLRVCFENGVRVKLGSSELDLSMGAEGSPDGLVAYNRTSGRVVWRCTNEGRCIVGEGTPTRAPATGVIIMGEAATGQIGLWQVHSDTLAELDGLLVRLQAVSVHGLRGVRVEHDGERSFVLLESGQVVIGDDISVPALLTCIDEYDVCTRRVVAGTILERQDEGCTVTVLPARVTGAVGQLYLEHFTAGGCARYVQRHASTYSLPTTTCIPVANYPGLANLVGAGKPLGAGTRGVIFSECASVAAEHVVSVTAWLDDTCATANGNGEITLGTCHVGDTSTRLYCVDMT